MSGKIERDVLVVDQYTDRVCLLCAVGVSKRKFSSGIIFVYGHIADQFHRFAAHCRVDGALDAFVSVRADNGSYAVICRIFHARISLAVRDEYDFAPRRIRRAACRILSICRDIKRTVRRKEIKIKRPIEITGRHGERIRILFEKSAVIRAAVQLRFGGIPVKDDGIFALNARIARNGYLCAAHADYTVSAAVERTARYIRLSQCFGITCIAGRSNVPYRGACARRVERAARDLRIAVIQYNVLCRIRKLAARNDERGRKYLIIIGIHLVVFYGVESAAELAAVDRKLRHVGRGNFIFL